MDTIRKGYKRGIAMVELIFAMVIIGIVLLSAPMLMHQASQSNSVALQQEAISAIMAHTSILLSKHWDEADANLSGGIAPILKTTQGDNIFDFTTTDTRGGLYAGSGRLTLYNSAPLGASVIGAEGGDRDDIDDYHGTENNVSIYGGQSTNAGTGDYVDVDLNISTQITYINDTPNTTPLLVDSIANTIVSTSVAGTTNIKFVQSQLTSNSGIEELNKSITLTAFSCNLGTTLINGEQK